MPLTFSSPEIEDAKAKVLEAGKALAALQAQANEQNGGYTPGPILSAAHSISRAYEALGNTAVYAQSTEEA